MIEASISVGNAEDLVLLLGTKDQHLRQIRGSIPAKFSTRDGKVVVQGDEDAVIQATAVLEELRATIGRQGPLYSEQVSQIIHRVTGNGAPRTAAIDIRNGRKIRPRTPGQCDYVQAIRTHDVVICTGPAGTGKTYLAVATAVNNAFIIMDEAQNTTVAQMKMFLTRMGEGSKVVVSGDTSQVDLPAHAKSGLTDAVQRLRGIEGFATVRLTGSDIVRHRLVQDIVRAYEEGTPG
jgi:phosphate starvation-inducible protein PhoH